MGFNKRIFNMKMLSKAYNENPSTAISRTIGKTDCFIFQDDFSEIIVDFYLDNQKETANFLLKNYVLGITTQASRNT